MNKELGQKFVEHPLFRWVDGMSTGGSRFSSEKQCFIYFDDDGVIYEGPSSLSWPDLTDPPTLRCLLEILREVPGWGTAYIQRNAKGSWYLTAFPPHLAYTFCVAEKSEPEALLAAWDAAWEEKGGEQ